MEASALFLVRLVHLVAGVSWLGEVITINFVLLPALFGASSEDRVALLSTVFPYIFRLATILGGTAVGSGLILLLWYTHLHPQALLHGRWGWLVLAGAALGAGLYGFHLFQESGAERSLAAHLAFSIDRDDPSDVQRLLDHLALFPRIGMVVLLVVAGLMVGAAHFV